MNEENPTEAEIYKHLLKVAEDLLVTGGLPHEILNKYNSLKEMTLSKFNINPSFNENNNILALNVNEENQEMSFNNDNIKDKDFVGFRQILDLIYESLSVHKKNLTMINSKEMNKISEINLQSCIFKAQIIKNSDHNSEIDKVLTTNSEKFGNFFNEIDEISKNILGQLKQNHDYIKDLEVHIKQIEEIEKNDGVETLRKNEEFESIEKHENENQSEKGSLDYPAEHKKLMDDLVSMQIACEDYKEKIQNLETQVINDEEQYTGIINDLQNKNQYLELKYDDILRETLEKDSSKNIWEDFDRNFNSISEKFSHMKEAFMEQTPSQYLDDENHLKFKFLKFLFEKFEDDNMWLVAKLKEMTQENLEIDKKLKIYEQQSASTIRSEKRTKNLEAASNNFELAENELKVKKNKSKNLEQIIKKKSIEYTGGNKKTSAKI